MKSSREGDFTTTHQVCSCKNQILSSKIMSEPRKRHNATQTPTSLINWEQRPLAYRNDIRQCGYNQKCGSNRSPLSYCACSGHSNVRVQTCHCHRLTSSTSHCCHYQSCQQHRHGRSRSTDQKRHANFHYQWPPLCMKDHSFHRKHKHYTADRHYQYRRHSNHHMHEMQCSSVDHLPNICTKSSLDSSDEPIQHPSGRLSSSTALNEIAIEIDAATMTEDNTTTATSNFAFKVAADSALAPIILAPLHMDSDGDNHNRPKRRSSLNSNTTIETDELSNEELEDSCRQQHTNYRSQCGCWHCCDHAMDVCEPNAERSLVQLPKNECVKIKRKRFIAADDYCSSCSSCSCSHIHTSSCSSFEEWHLEGRQSSRSAPNSNAFTVSVDCHNCNVKRHSTVSSINDVGGEDNHYMGEEVHPQPLIHETSDSSAHTSRRSSVTASFCSCTSNKCCCCEDSATPQMCTARDTTITASNIGNLGYMDGEEQHSSTLTPLTNPSSVVSTPVGDDGDVTIRSLSQALTDDTSSQSHSADYYSLSSSQQHSQGTPCKSPKRITSLSNDLAVPNVDVIDHTQDMEDHSKKSRKSCKYFGKHHRHKRPESPIDSYL